MVTRPAGALPPASVQMLIHWMMMMERPAHLSRNTHLQVAFSATPPPMTGPAKLPNAVAAASWAAIEGYRALGTIS